MNLVAQRQREINRISKSGDITMTQARRSLLSHFEAMQQAKEIILKYWGKLDTKMDIAQKLKKFNYMGFHGQPIGLKDVTELFHYMEDLSEETLEEYGWI